MKIGEIRDGMKRVEVEGEIDGIGEPRVVNLHAGGQAKVAEGWLNGINGDPGKIKISLWNDQIAMVTNGCQVHIEQGFCRSFRGELQLSVGKFGRLELM
jgi:replication factor A1